MKFEFCDEFFNLEEDEMMLELGCRILSDVLPDKKEQIIIVLSLLAREIENGGFDLDELLSQMEVGDACLH